VIVLLTVVVFKSLVQPVSLWLSWTIGLDITRYIHAVEGLFVARIQGFASPLLTDLFTVAYVDGFSLLLAVPPLAYAALEDPRPFRETVAAFSVNYLAGVLFYTLFIAYGPRNFVPQFVESLLYTHDPAAYLVTSQITNNTNVFPSLHTSFSVTVALLAWRTRGTYPLWAAVSAVLAALVVVSTMYLGIHWAVDVVAGAVLGVVAVRYASRDPLAPVDERIRSLAARVRARVAG
jgi:membrane-associated phospholipid phosphatase